MSMKALLESASPGLRCWLDKDEDATEAGMRRGVAGSRYYLLFLTQVRRWWGWGGGWGRGGRREGGGKEGGREGGGRREGWRGGGMGTNWQGAPD